MFFYIGQQKAHGCAPLVFLRDQVKLLWAKFGKKRDEKQFQVCLGTQLGIGAAAFQRLPDLTSIETDAAETFLITAAFTGEAGRKLIDISLFYQKLQGTGRKMQDERAVPGCRRMEAWPLPARSE